MKIKFLGAAGTVTGSSYVLTSDSGQSILIDLGMFQGPEEIDRLNFEPYAYDCSQLSGALLTHAHLDHCGRLPILFKHGFGGQITMTSVTLDLVELVLLDSAKIAKYEPETALYDASLVNRVLEQSRTIKYGTRVQMGDFEVTFRDAGHLLGAASIEVVDQKSTGQIRKVVFSGDLGNDPEPLLQAKEVVGAADVVVVESTYGDRLHPDGDASKALADEISAVEEAGSVLLVPSFSMEKTQELLHMIKHLKAEGKVSEETPVYLDSPMAQKATRIYKSRPRYMNEHIRREIGTDSPFDFPYLVNTVSGKESKRIAEDEGAKVIIAGAGMMVGGRIVAHAKRYLPDPANRIFFVGYQGVETLGREILEGAREVEIDEEMVAVRARVGATKGMSSHADQKQLMEWLGAIKGVKKVYITHGEDESRRVLAQKVGEELGIGDIELPRLNEEVGF